MYGTVIAKERVFDFYGNVLVDINDTGIVTAFSPEKGIFTVRFSENKCTTFTDGKDRFFERFKYDKNGTT